MPYISFIECPRCRRKMECYSDFCLTNEQHDLYRCDKCGGTAVGITDVRTWTIKSFVWKAKMEDGHGKETV